MPLWPVAVAIMILVFAILLYRMLPDLTEGGNGILWVAGAFLVFYAVAAYLIGRSVPAVGDAAASGVFGGRFTETEVEDVIVR